MSVAHVSLSTGPNNYEAVREFYVTILGPLGYKVYFETAPKVLGLANPSGNPDFWLHCGGTDIPRITAETAEKRGAKAHVAFNASTRGEVDEWYKAAVKAGGIPNGEPGERPYTPGYYAAYVLDPVGNNIEVCSWSPPQKA